ncbi:MAG: transcriptional regulator [Dehalococcoidia bacterium]|nr:transcriptional regulator [Dehalococcoidia bacterium]
MPLGIFEGQDNFGTNSDGTKTEEYCMFCYQDGAFTTPNLTLDEMISMSVRVMTSELNFSEQRAVELSNSVIPNLRRWKDTEH